VVEPDPGGALAAALAEQFAGTLNVHCILAPNYGVTVVEAFALGADKLAAVRYVAQALPVSTARVAAVGDDVNDLALLRGVGLSVAMPSAPPAVVAATQLVARDGLAVFIHDLVAGRYDDGQHHGARVQE
jgi:hydroxymethylpyrimidine pyrophosphatase-like HAD family hydrolase